MLILMTESLLHIYRQMYLCVIIERILNFQFSELLLTTWGMIGYLLIVYLLRLMILHIRLAILGVMIIDILHQMDIFLKL